jgi:hypothetical protein
MTARPVAAKEARQVIDLRDPADGAGPPEPSVPLWKELLDLAADTGARPPVAEDGTTHPAWRTLLTLLHELDGRPRYVGTFGRTVDELARGSERLPAEERPLAAAFVVDRVAATATSWTDFHHGVMAARSIDATSFAPGTVVGTLVRAGLRHPAAPSRPAAAGYALRAALELLAEAGRAGLRVDDFWPIRAAILQLPAEQREELRPLVARLQQRDRAMFDELLPRSAGALGRALRSVRDLRR